MLVRDFIDTSLYHKEFGYFNKQAYIFTPPSPIQFGKIKDEYEFLNYLSELYESLDKPASSATEIARQVWHTPTELFRPFYGRAVANYITSQYLSGNNRIDNVQFPPVGPLRVYEIGGGNGTLMVNILDFVREKFPDIYKDVKYTIIEISGVLAGKQVESAREAGHESVVEVVRKSIFEWDQVVNEECFFIGMEVMDNLSHDLIRYDARTKEPRQGIVLTDESLDYTEAYELVSDPLIDRFLKMRSNTSSQSPLSKRTMVSLLTSKLPFASNLTAPEFIPTKLFRLVEILNEKFPKSRVVLSDFYELPDAVAGLNAPVVQTRYEGQMIACSTYLVQPGWFDIFFPTNFELLQELYGQVSGKQGRVVQQRDMMQEYGEVDKTELQSGENPLLGFYKNVKFFIS
ncbi:hypothetical protein HK098_003879 [Nowakowskiella sp. JEL0407]|nr:hypothetical protein HK098_003879 [Nowakowskiella sp. JEL0407]